MACWLAAVRSPPLSRRPAPQRSSLNTASPATTPRLKTAGLVLDPADLTHVGRERRNLGKSRPQTAHQRHAAGRRAAAGSGHLRCDGVFSRNANSTAPPPRSPNPGKLPLLHRLSRTEYQNAIRDLLGARRAAQRNGLFACCCRPTTPAAASTTSPICCSSRRPPWSATWTRRARSAAWPWAIPTCR